jgi:phosphopantothenoylcysteine decarboxylase/phosphopantothenate--cysteine ligase
LTGWSGAIRPKPLQGKRVLLTVGATREFIDDVRFISNLSTGRTGFAIARVLRWHGADVQIIAGYTEENPPPEIPLTRVSSAEEMLRAVLENVKFCRPVGDELGGLLITDLRRGWKAS